MTTEESSSSAQPPVLCDFCGRNSAEAGPMIEGRALIPVSTGRPIAHICVHCVGVCDSLFEQHQRKNTKGNLTIYEYGDNINIAAWGFYTPQPSGLRTGTA